MKIVLASQSPRRARLLKKIFSQFKIVPSFFDEGQIKETRPIEFAKKVARAKAELVTKDIKEPALIVAADTIVILKGKIIGKPKDDRDAFNILTKLAGREQSVVTAFCLINTKTGQKVVDFDESVVKMRQISSAEIRAYAASGEGKDKAGAYAIQGRADQYIEYIKGDYYNVVGLPLNKLKKVLNENWPDEFSLEK